MEARDQHSLSRGGATWWTTRGLGIFGVEDAEKKANMVARDGARKCVKYEL